jgi:hypothetical protein
MPDAAADEIPPVVLGADSVTVAAGTPGSLRIVDRPRSSGPAVRCAWHRLVWGNADPIGTAPVVPVEGSGYVLWCVHVADGSVVDGYPLLTVYDPADPIPGGAVSSADAARFALDRIRFEEPRPRLSPEAAQIVGVPTWLAVTSQLAYGDATAQAGPVWASVRPVFRDVSWAMGDGTAVVCADDVDVVWEPGRPADSQSSRCTHVYETASGPDGHPATVTATWDILWRNDRDPNRWQLFDTLSITTTVPIVADQLQAAIR